MNPASMPPLPPEPDGDLGRVISTSLRHDDKRITYKIALIRAVNDVALSFPDPPTGTKHVAIPLRFLAMDCRVVVGAQECHVADVVLAATAEPRDVVALTEGATVDAMWVPLAHLSAPAVHR